MFGVYRPVLAHWEPVAMGRFTNRHPPDLAQLVGIAVANGAKTTDISRQLAAGTFHGHEGPYEMPIETVRYYGKKERRNRAARTVTDEARHDPKRAVDDLARLLLSAAQEGLAAVRPGIDKDAKALKEWADALKAINSLVSDTSRIDSKGKRPSKPVDPLTAKLSSPSLPAAKEASKEALPDKPINAAHTPTQADTDTHASAGFMQKPPHWPVSTPRQEGGEGVPGRPVSPVSAG